MASAPIRDQVGDHLITQQNAALVRIDYQPSQIGAVGSTDSLACELQRGWNRPEPVHVAERWRPYRSLAVSNLFASEFEKGT